MQNFSAFCFVWDYHILLRIFWYMWVWSCSNIPAFPNFCLDSTILVALGFKFVISAVILSFSSDGFPFLLEFVKFFVYQSSQGGPIFLSGPVSSEILVKEVISNLNHTWLGIPVNHRFHAPYQWELTLIITELEVRPMDHRPFFGSVCPSFSKFQLYLSKGSFNIFLFHIFLRRPLFISIQSSWLLFGI